VKIEATVFLEVQLPIFTFQRASESFVSELSSYLMFVKEFLSSKRQMIGFSLQHPNNQFLTLRNFGIQVNRQV
jgi:hypothetical protein